MLAIGRWEKPIDNLVALGLMLREDKFNNRITRRGMEVAANAEVGAGRSVSDIQADIKDAQDRYHAALEAAAQKLLEAAKEKQRLTGQFPNKSIYEMGQMAIQRAMEIAG